ncbi:hypothetical protein KFS98_003618 [Salmonella enterica]|nr:hypothetical protein [Salmonella enterica]
MITSEIRYASSSVLDVKSSAHLCTKMMIIDMLSKATKSIIFGDLSTLDQQGKDYCHSIGYTIDSILDSANPDRTIYSEEEMPDEKMPEAYHLAEAALRDLATRLQEVYS